MGNQDTDMGAFLAGFILGGLAGAMVALLMAPQSGEETRTVIRDKGIELKEKATLTAEEARARAEAALEDARQRAEEAMEEVRERAEELRELGQERFTELQKRGQVVLEEQKSKLDAAVEKGKKAASDDSAAAA